MWTAAASAWTARIPRFDARQPAHVLGMVLQDTWLKTGTIRENIVMGKPDATDEEVIAAAKASHAHGFIRRLPHGYDTPHHETAAALSQGQKQLLCIARVMLCLPPMLILDEATSSIDTRTEIKIQEAFEPSDAGPHELHRRPSPLDHPRGGRHSGDEGRPHHRAGQPQDRCWRKTASTPTLYQQPVCAVTLVTNGERWGVAPYPTRELSSLDLPYLIALQSKEKKQLLSYGAKRGRGLGTRPQTGLGGSPAHPHSKGTASNRQKTLSIQKACGFSSPCFLFML